MDKDTLIITLQKTIEAQTEQLKQQTHLLEKLQVQIEQLLRQLYGKKSEKKKKEESNNSPQSETPPCTNQPPKKNAQKPKGHRLPEHLQRVDVIYDLPEKDKECEHCCGRRHRIGQKVTEQIDFMPAQLIVKKHIRYQYACRCGLGGVKIATMPNRPIEKGLPGAGLLAEVLVSKYQDAMPLYRQMLRFARYGYECADSTLCDWVRESTFLLEAIVRLMREDLIKERKIHTDDTPVPVLATGKTKLGRLWVYLADENASNKMCIYDYTPSRAQEGPINFLKGYTGFLQADAFSGYDVLYNKKGITEVGCFAHARRKFYEVASAAQGSSHAGEIVDMIGALYAIERKVKLLSAHERYHYRKKYSKPKLKRLRRKINICNRRAISKTPFHTALNYAINHWVALTRYLADGILDIDNNKAERAIKPVVIGRKNWMFAGSDAGGKRAAIAYSIIETCKMNNINTYEYLRDVLSKIPNMLHKDLASLLPYHWKSPNID